MVESEYELLEKAILDTALVSKTDEKGVIYYVNDNYINLSGYSREELVGSTHNLVSSGYHERAFYEEMWGRLRSGKIWRGDICNRKKTGELYWINTVIFPLKKKGKITGYYSIKRNITEAKNEAALMQKQIKELFVLSKLLEVSLSKGSINERLYTSLEVILSLPWLPIKQKGGVFLVKEGALELVTQKNLNPPLLEKCARVEFGQCLCGLAAQTKELQYAHCVDERHSIQFENMEPHGHYNIPLLDQNEVVGVIVVYLGHGHKKNEKEIEVLNIISKIMGGLVKTWNLENELQKSRLQSINTSRLASLGQLAGGISHEINNPLAIIKGTAQILEEKLQKVEGSEFYLKKLKTIMNNSERIQNVMSTMRHLSLEKHSGGLQVAEPQKLLEEVVTVFKDSMAQKGVDCQLIFEPHLPKIYINPIEISQVFFHLLKNAQEAMEICESPMILIEVKASKDTKVVFEVCNNGPKIPEEIAAKIMDPYFTTKPMGKGPGLGLSIAQSLCEQNKGKLYYEPREEKTCFVVEFPFLESH